MARVASVLSFFCLALTSLTLSKKIRLEKCPTNIVPKPELEFNKFSGSWIQYGDYGFSLKSRTAICTRFVFSKEDRSEAKMSTTYFYGKWYKTKEYMLKQQIPGTYDVESVYDVYELSLEERQLREYKRKLKKLNTFHILDTDYECWAITYKCKERLNYPIYSVIKSALFVRNNTAPCMNEQIKTKYISTLSKQLEIEPPKKPKITWLNVDGCAGGKQ